MRYFDHTCYIYHLMPKYWESTHKAFVCQAENNRVDHIKVASCSGETQSEYQAFECQAGTPLVPHFIQDNAE